MTGQVKWLLWTIKFSSNLGLSWVSDFMMTSSNGDIFRVTGHLCGEFTGRRWITLTKASDAELWCSFICAWINGWVNNREAGDLRRYLAHCDVIVMYCHSPLTFNSQKLVPFSALTAELFVVDFEDMCFIENWPWCVMRCYATSDRKTTTRLCFLIFPLI